ncbi:hypothetical protein KKB71_00085 [Patescibacteria group bacterium]|nr:hypothetical protein [Patescibacteria group bacterium]MBU2219005.1 hypothetical protein [Patescibacteria group bacterium]MBU2263070.1 hypothetical protein [Patescibacteria group bacterium]
MLSIFPELFNYSYLAPFLLRIALALVLIRIGYLSFKKTNDKCQKSIDITQIISAVFVALGLLTQIAALVIMAMIATEVIKAGIQKIPVERKILKFLMFIIAVSLMLLGPGLFAIDLPL